MIQSKFVRTFTLLALAFAGLSAKSEAQAGPPGQPSPAASSDTTSSGGSASSGGAATSGPAMTLSPAQQQFQQSVPQGTATSTPIALTLNDAIVRGLRANLGLLTSVQSNAQSRAQRLQALSALLPTVTGSIQEAAQQTNLAALGFKKIPGFNIPLIVGPFSYSTAEAEAKIPVFNWSSWQRYRGSK